MPIILDPADWLINVVVCRGIRHRHFFVSKIEVASSSRNIALSGSRYLTVPSTYRHTATFLEATSSFAERQATDSRFAPRIGL